jgi:hypothetical protein
VSTWRHSSAAVRRLSHLAERARVSHPPAPRARRPGTRRLSRTSSNRRRPPNARPASGARSTRAARANAAATTRRTERARKPDEFGCVEWPKANGPKHAHSLPVVTEPPKHAPPARSARQRPSRSRIDNGNAEAIDASRADYQRDGCGACRRQRSAPRPLYFLTQTLVSRAGPTKPEELRATTPKHARQGPVFETGPRRRTNALKEVLSAIRSPAPIRRIRLPIRLPLRWRPAGASPVRKPSGAGQMAARVGEGSSAAPPGRQCLRQGVEGDHASHEHRRELAGDGGRVTNRGDMSDKGSRRLTSPEASPKAEDFVILKRRGHSPLITSRHRMTWLRPIEATRRPFR